MSGSPPTATEEPTFRFGGFGPTGDIAPLVSIPAIDVFFCSRAATGACRNPWKLQEAALVLSAGVAALFFTIARTRHEIFTPLASIGE
jgi:hypothetical protein